MAVCCPSAWQGHAALLSQFLGVGDPAKTGRGFCLEVSRGCTRVSAGTVAHAQVHLEGPGSLTLAGFGSSRATRGKSHSGDLSETVAVDELYKSEAQSHLM